MNQRILPQAGPARKPDVARLEPIRFPGNDEPHSRCCSDLPGTMEGRVRSGTASLGARVVRHHQCYTWHRNASPL